MSRGSYKGYQSTNFYIKHNGVHRFHQGYKGYIRLWDFGSLITLYNLVAFDNRKCFSKEISRIITFTVQKGVLGRYII